VGDRAEPGELVQLAAFAGDVDVAPARADHDSVRSRQGGDARGERRARRVIGRDIVARAVGIAQAAVRGPAEVLDLARPERLRVAVGGVDRGAVRADGQRLRVRPVRVRARASWRAAGPAPRIRPAPGTTPPAPPRGTRATPQRPRPRPRCSVCASCPRPYPFQTTL
jgi:hypothetical protein